MIGKERLHTRTTPTCCPVHAAIPWAFSPECEGPPAPPRPRRAARVAQQRLQDATPDKEPT